MENLPININPQNSNSQNTENKETKHFIVFEFFSGIGGMHEALKLINNIKIEHIFPFDINLNANTTYQQNYNIKPYAITIESFSLNDYEKIIESIINKNNNFYILWTMSPPCQPFTRQGNQEGIEDNRSNAFVHLMNNIFLKTKYLPDFFMLENVKNFEISEANKMLIDILNIKKYNFLQFLLSPVQFNIPNARLRFYLIASKIKNFCVNDYSNDINKIIQNPNLLFKNKIIESVDIRNFINFDDKNDYELNKEYYLNKNVLNKKSCLSMDIALLENKTTNCFTKNYSRLFKGTGSILLVDSEKYEKNVDPIKLSGYIRFFTPKEILKFLFFGESFTFPKNFTNKTKYRLLGNSINVKVVNILLDYLLN